MGGSCSRVRPSRFPWRVHARFQDQVEDDRPALRPERRPGRSSGGSRSHHPRPQGFCAAGEDAQDRAVEALRPRLRSLVQPVRAGVRREEQGKGRGRLRGDERPADGHRRRHLARRRPRRLPPQRRRRLALRSGARRRERRRHQAGEGVRTLHPGLEVDRVRQEQVARHPQLVHLLSAHHQHRLLQGGGRAVHGEDHLAGHDPDRREGEEGGPPLRHRLRADARLERQPPAHHVGLRRQHVQQGGENGARSSSTRR